MTSPTVRTEAESRPSALTRIARFARGHIVVIAPVVVYLVLVLAGITTSSIGTDSLRQDPSDPQGTQIGQSQVIRSDEYTTESPIWLGEMARGGQDAITPLSVSNDFFAQLPDGPVSAIVFFDGTALGLSPLIPDEMLFAAKWWLPTLLLFLGLPIWFRQVTGRLRWGYLASALILFAPATAWWSSRPINTLGFVAAGCALAIVGARLLDAKGWRPRTGGVLVILAAGILLARTPTYYQPLAIIVGIPLVLGTAAFLLWRPAPLRQRLVALAAIAVSGAVWTALLFWENRDAVVAGLSTVYPGDRQSSGFALSMGHVFGATNLGWLEQLGTTDLINQTELASSFTVLLMVLVVLVAAQRWRGGKLQAAVLVPIVVCAVFWLAWTTVDWGTLGASLPLINRVPATRAAESVGYIAIIAFCLFMSQWREPKRWAVPAAAGGLAAFFSAYAGSAMTGLLVPGLAAWMIWLSAVITGGAVFALVRWPHRIWPLLVASAAALALTATSAPILIGLGDLRASTTAQDFMSWGQQTRESGTVWATDSRELDSLLTATGTPSLSTRQQIGPDVSQWNRIDPGGLHEDYWNRGGTHIGFEWKDTDELVFEQPSADFVLMVGSPCVVAERMPELTRIASSVALQAPCLTEETTFEWGGSTFIVYAVDASTS